MSQERGTEGGEEKKERGTEEGEEKKKNNKGFFGTLSPTKGQMILQLERLKRKKHDPELPPAGEPMQPHTEPTVVVDSGSEPTAEPVWVQLNGEELFHRVQEVLKGGAAAPDLGSRLGAWRKTSALRQEENSVLPQEELLRQFHLQVGESVRLHFPSLPPEVTADQPHTYLKQVQEVVQRELLRLAPVLREAGLLGTVIDRYHTHTVSQLDLLLQRNLKSDQTFRLLQWTLHTYLRLLGQSELAADVQVATDPLLLPEWLHCAKSKLLITTKESVAGCLKRILLMEEEEGESCDHSDEEAFIRLPVDVTQCLNGVVKKAKALSSSLLKEIQRMCLSQLHTFLHSLQALERKRMSAGLGAGEGGILHLFRTINTCRELRLLAGQLASEAQTDAAAVGLLEELEAQAKEQLLHTATHSTEAALKTYFKTGGDDMCDVTTRIEPLFAPLPLVKDTHTRKVLVDSVYQNITSLYLRHLLLSNRSQLDKRWSDVGLRVRRDAEELHKTFTQQEGSVEKRCVSLQKISEVLKTNDVNTLKLVLIEIINECPGISGEEQLNTLLRWKGQLSRQQQTEVMDAVVEYCPRSAPNDSPAHTLAPPPAPPLRPASRWYRAMSCLRPPITD